MGLLRCNPIVSRGASVFFPVLFFSSPQASPPKVELDNLLFGSLKHQGNIESKRMTLTRMQLLKTVLHVKLVIRTLKYSHCFKNEAGGDRSWGFSSPSPTCSWSSLADDSPPYYQSLKRVPSRLLTVSLHVWQLENLTVILTFFPQAVV